jgi:hypothetical protein
MFHEDQERIVLRKNIAATGKTQQYSSVRYVHEFCFSLNLAWMFEWYDRQKGHPGFFPWAEFSPFLKRLYGHVGMNEPGTVIEQVVWSVLLALLLFFLIRVLASFLATDLFLEIIGGAVAVVGFPTFYLVFASSSFSANGGGTHRPWPWLEIALALVFCALFYFRKFPIPAFIAVLLLGLHFVYWGWVAGSWSGVVVVRSYILWSPAFWILTLFYAGFPLIGILSSLIWGKYLRAGSIEGVSGKDASPFKKGGDGDLQPCPHV